MRRWVCAIVLAVLADNAAAAEPLWVIVAQDAPLDSLSREAVRDVFFGRSALENITPADRAEESLRAAFYLRLTGQSLNSVRAYWAKRVFTGRGRPPDAVAADALPQALKNIPYLLTYIPAGQKPAGSKIVLELYD